VNNIQENPFLLYPHQNLFLSSSKERNVAGIRECEREKEREREKVSVVCVCVCVYVCVCERERESLIVPGMLCWVNVNYSVFITWTHSLPKLAINPG